METVHVGLFLGCNGCVRNSVSSLLKVHTWTRRGKYSVSAISAHYDSTNSFGERINTSLLVLMSADVVAPVRAERRPRGEAGERHPVAPRPRCLVRTGGQSLAPQSPGWNTKKTPGGNGGQGSAHLCSGSLPPATGEASETGLSGCD